MSSSPTTDSEPSQKEAFESAFSDAVKALAKDVPLLLHGSGDVVPSAVNPETVHLVSCLTAQYIEKLVDAGLDSHFTFLNYPDQVRVPPPRFEREPMATKPPPFSETHPSAFSKAATPGKNSNDASTDNLTLRKRLRKRPMEEYWDDDLPAPKIRKQTTTNNNTDATPSSSRRATKKNNLLPSRDPSQPVAIDEWVGAVGVDLRRDWIRKIHVKDAVSVQSFVFPVCHDTYAYNRVREIRAAKRTLDPLLQDSTIHDLIQTEGRIPRPGSLGQKKKDDEDEQPDDGQGEPEWPGLDFILPVHKLYEP